MTLLDEIIEQVEDNHGNQWMEYWCTEALPDNRGKYYDHSVTGYFTQVTLHSRDYRDGVRAAVFVEANYVTTHSGERLNTFHVLKVYAGTDAQFNRGAKAEKMFRLAKEMVNRNS